MQPGFSMHYPNYGMAKCQHAQSNYGTIIHGRLKVSVHDQNYGMVILGWSNVSIRDQNGGATILVHQQCLCNMFLFPVHAQSIFQFTLMLNQTCNHHFHVHPITFTLQICIFLLIPLQIPILLVNQTFNIQTTTSLVLSHPYTVNDANPWSPKHATNFIKG